MLQVERPPAGSGEPASSCSPSDDTALAARLVAGDSDALASLVARYWRPMVSFAAGRVGSQDVAEDLVQEAFVRVWDHREQLRADTSPRAYLYRVLRNLITDDHRRQVHRARWVEMRSRQVEPEVPSPALLLEADQLATAAAAAIAALPERRREVFVLAHLHGLSFKEIAVALGITRRTVANHMSLALKELHSDLAPFLDRAPRTRAAG